ncbi:MAG: hypothetical protein Q7K35_02455 [bacterium]|nr:hypothetical protein [bacterium]
MSQEFKLGKAQSEQTRDLESEQTRDKAQIERAKDALVGQFSDFNEDAQLAVVILLLRMPMRDGSNTLKQCINSNYDLIHDGKKIKGANRQHEMDNLILLSNFENGLVGNTLTVREVREILEEEIRK